MFLGREISEQRDYSDRIAEDIDEDVHSLISVAYRTAKDLLTSRRDQLEQLAKQLIAHESVDDKKLEELFNSPPVGSPQPAPAD